MRVGGQGLAAAGPAERTAWRGRRRGAGDRRQSRAGPASGRPPPRWPARLWTSPSPTPSPAGPCSWSATSTTTRCGGTPRPPIPANGPRIRPGAPGRPTASHWYAAHLEMARRDPDYKFVLAEVDYLKPYWDTHPEDRADLRRFVRQGRVEIMGGTYNEPNTNLTGPETAIRNFVHGIGFQRHVMGADPATAWQLDVFGHDPQFPGMAADAGLTSSSWARGPHHQWGPMAGDGDPDADAVRQRVRVDRAVGGRPADPLHARALLGGVVDGLGGDAGGGRGRHAGTVPGLKKVDRHPQRPAAGRHRLHATQQVGHRDSPRLERPLHLAAVRLRAARRVLRRGPRRTGRARGASRRRRPAT